MKILRIESLVTSTLGYDFNECFIEVVPFINSIRIQDEQELIPCKLRFYTSSQSLINSKDYFKALVNDNVMDSIYINLGS